MGWVRILLIALGVIFAGGGTSYYVYAWARTSAARDWPSVQGQVIASRIDTETRYESSGNTRRQKTHRRAYVAYRYEVAGRPFESTRIWLTTQTEFSTAEAADAFIAGYRPGAAVPVFYNPADPSDAALIVSQKLWPILIFTGVGLLMIALGVFLPLRR